MKEQLVAIPVPDGFFVTGNYGDGHWRVCHDNNPQTYLGIPQLSAEAAGQEAFRLAALPNLDLLIKKRC